MFSTGGHWELASKNHRLILPGDRGSWPVQQQSSTAGHWELPSTITVFYWWTLASCQLQTQSSSSQHREQPSTKTYSECKVCLGSPGIHALHDDLVLFALHHVVGEHGVEVGYGRRQDDPVGAELVIPDLPEETDWPQFRAICLVRMATQEMADRRNKAWTTQCS